MKKLLISSLLLLAGHAFGACTGSSPNWTASPDYTSIQTCVNNAAATDHVTVTSGTVTGTPPITMSKNITLDGGGVATINAGTANAITITTQAGSGNARLTGFTITMSPQANDNADGIIVNQSASNPAFRVDHNTITQSGNGFCISIFGLGTGLLDNNTLNGGAAAECIHALGAGSGNTGGWTNDVVPGSANMIFIEDNTMTGTDATFYAKLIEGFYGAQVVLRHNHLKFASIDFHGNSGTPTNISTRWYEVYNNDFNDNGKNQDQTISPRGGTGLIYNNTVIGTPIGTMSIKIQEDATCSNPDSNAYHIGSGILSGPTGANYSTPLYVWNNSSFMGIGNPTGCFTSGSQYVVSGIQPTLVRCESAADVLAGCSNTGAAPTYTYTPYTYPNPLQGITPPPPAPPTGMYAEVIALGVRRIQ